MLSVAFCQWRRKTWHSFYFVQYIILYNKTKLLLDSVCVVSRVIMVSAKLVIIALFGKCGHGLCVVGDESGIIWLCYFKPIVYMLLVIISTCNFKRDHDFLLDSCMYWFDF